MDEVSGVAVVFGGAFCLTRGFRGWRPPGHARRGGCASTRPLLCVPIVGRRGAIGVLCFSLGSGLRERGKWRALFFSGFPLRGNDGLGAVREPPLRVGLWVPACAGTTQYASKARGGIWSGLLRVNDLGFAPPP